MTAKFFVLRTKRLNMDMLLWFADESLENLVFPGTCPLCQKRASNWRQFRAILKKIHLGHTYKLKYILWWYQSISLMLSLFIFIIIHLTRCEYVIWNTNSCYTNCTRYNASIFSLFNADQENISTVLQNSIKSNEKIGIGMLVK